MSVNLESHLNDLQWNDLKKFAKDNGIKVAGTRDVITSEILSTLGEEHVEALNDSSNKVKANFESPKLQVPKKSRVSTRKSARKTPAKESFLVVVPQEEEIQFPVEQSHEVEEEELENVEPKSLFPSPDMHVRQTRKPILRSPSPVRSPEPKMNKARTPAKNKTPAKSVTRSTRKAKQAEPVEVLPVEREVAKAPTVAEPEAKNEISAEVEATSVGAPVDAKNAFSLVGAFSAIAVIAAVFSNGIQSAPATPDWSNSVSLKGSDTVYMTQGDIYTEQGVAFAPEIQKAILDGNASPSISYEYSEPAVAFSDFLADVGSFNVEYQISSPWLGEISLTRQVIVSDVNECSYSGDNDMFKHNCSPSQTCQNTVGSFSCV